MTLVLLTDIFEVLDKWWYSRCVVAMDECFCDQWNEIACIVNALVYGKSHYGRIKWWGKRSPEN